MARVLLRAFSFEPRTTVGVAQRLIAYRTKYPLRGGRTHRIMTPMELPARLAALMHSARAPSSPCSWTSPDSVQKLDSVHSGSSPSVPAREICRRARTSVEVETSRRAESGALGLPTRGERFRE